MTPKPGLGVLVAHRHRGGGGGREGGGAVPLLPPCRLSNTWSRDKIKYINFNLFLFPRFLTVFGTT